MQDSRSKNDSNKHIGINLPLAKQNGFLHQITKKDS